MNVRGVEQPLVAGLYADDTVLLAESEIKIWRLGKGLKCWVCFRGDKGYVNQMFR